jgi:NADH dehydrogenase [ubiquinone] 1 alpha subcomplex assembly factor 1
MDVGEPPRTTISDARSDKHTRSDIPARRPYRTFHVRHFDTALLGSSAHVRSRRTPRTVQRALCAAGAALVIVSCGAEAPAESAQSAATTPAPTTDAIPPPAIDPAPAGPAPAEPEAVDTTPETTLVAPSEPLSTACRRLTDFDDGQGWVVVNDGVMGGRSNGAIDFTDSVMQFTGDVVTAGGGFTSVRLQLADDELADSHSLVLRVRTDERTYGLTLEDDAQAGRRAISHRADLIVDGPTDADGWQTAALSYDELQPSVFGQPLDAPPFDPDQAKEIGIIISDGIDGPFAFEVSWIDVCGDQ